MFTQIHYSVTRTNHDKQHGTLNVNMAIPTAESTGALNNVDKNVNDANGQDSNLVIRVKALKICKPS